MQEIEIIKLLSKFLSLCLQGVKKSKKEIIFSSFLISNYRFKNTNEEQMQQKFFWHLAYQRPSSTFWVAQS